MFLFLSPALCVCVHAHVCVRERVKVLIVGTERLMGAVLRAIVSHSTVSQGTLFMHGATYAADTDTHCILQETLGGCACMFLCANESVSNVFMCVDVGIHILASLRFEDFTHGFVFLVCAGSCHDHSTHMLQ